MGGISFMPDNFKCKTHSLNTTKCEPVDQGQKDLTSAPGNVINESLTLSSPRRLLQLPEGHAAIGDIIMYTGGIFHTGLANVAQESKFVIDVSFRRGPPHYQRSGQAPVGASYLHALWGP